jgi:4-hydroxybenzoate polyprenyltransferase
MNLDQLKKKRDSWHFWAQVFNVAFIILTVCGAIDDFKFLVGALAIVPFLILMLARYYIWSERYREAFVEEERLQRKEKFLGKLRGEFDKE